MKKINLNDNLEIDLDVLIDTRLLIQANSGGGKSWCIRRILEQSHGKVQQIVIDLEGEFSTLREKYDYVVAGKGGDTPADPRSAALLARRLLELNVSAIIDLYELDQYNRRRFVKLFLDALIDAPKELWHPCLVVIDEAHFFCPEKGQSEAMNSVIELATRGRKRGFSAILATQRLSKLHKDAAAECNNKLIGRTGLDVDMKRASEELGFTTKEQYLSLRSLNPGEFFAFGPAISNEVIRTTIGKVETSHPKAGSRILTAPPIPPTSMIKNILSKLSDLPKEAEEEARTIDELKQENKELKKKFERNLLSSTKTDFSKEDLKKALKPHIVAFQSIENGYKNKIQQWKEFSIGLMDIISSINNSVNKLIPPDEGIGMSYAPEKIELPKENEKKHIKPSPEFYKMNGFPNEESINKLPLAPRKIYSFLYGNQNKEFSKVQLGAVTGYSHSSGGFNNALAKLNSLGLIERNGSMIKIGIVNEELADNNIPEYSPELWLDILPLAPRKIYEILWNDPHNQFSKEQLGKITEYSHTSGGFNNALAKLNALGLIVRLGNGMIKLNDELLNL